MKKNNLVDRGCDSAGRWECAIFAVGNGVYRLNVVNLDDGRQAHRMYDGEDSKGALAVAVADFNGIVKYGYPPTTFRFS